jgi:glutathione synthase/RimK-type ligase-like ATP-grasp enzyme
LPQGDIYPIFTRRLTESDLATPRLGACPVLIQAEVPKKCEYRVFVVGNDVLSVRLQVGESLDWRELGAFVVEREYVPLDPALERRLLDLVRSWGLVYAALDLLEDFQRAIYFLELNPNGTYEFCDSLVTPRITARLAYILAAVCR